MPSMITRRSARVLVGGLLGALVALATLLAPGAAAQTGSGNKAMYNTNNAPVAMDDTFTLDEDTEFGVFTPGVLATDSDADGDPLSAVLVDDVTHGALTFNSDGSFFYTPDADYHGSDSFTYKANDGTADSNLATVTLTISPINDAPTTKNNVFSTNEDAVVTVHAPGVLGNDSDADDDTLSAVLVDDVAHGMLTLKPDGSFIYTPTLHYHGTDNFTYRANDGIDESNLATVILPVHSVNDLPAAMNDTFTLDEDSEFGVFAPGVLVNDSDPDGDPLSAVLVDDVAHGALTFNSDGSFFYTPDADYHGADSFTYKANDGKGDSNLATVSLVISPINDGRPSIALSAEGACAIDNTPSATVSVQLSDPDGVDSLTVSGTSSDQSLVPNANIVANGAGADRTVMISAVAGQSGTATITLRVRDESFSATIKLTFVVGTPSADTLTGTTGRDVILGLGGSDVIDGGTGSDLLCGGSGRDTLNGEGGSDTIDGGTDGDTLRGHSGNDTLKGGTGKDHLSGGQGDDTLVGENGSDTLTGEGGADSFSGGGGTDTVTDFNAAEGDTQDATIP